MTHLLRVDWGVICLHLAIKIRMSFQREKGGQRENHGFNFRLKLDLHSYFHATFSLLEDFEFLDYFDHTFTILLSIFKCGYNLVGPKIYKWKSLTNRTQLSRKQCWQLLLNLFVAFNNWKIFLFSSFSASPYNLRFRLWPLKVLYFPPVSRKSVFLLKFQTSKTSTSIFCRLTSVMTYIAVISSSGTIRIYTQLLIYLLDMREPPWTDFHTACIYVSWEFWPKKIRHWCPVLYKIISFHYFVTMCKSIQNYIRFTIEKRSVIRFNSKLIFKIDSYASTLILLLHDSLGTLFLTSIFNNRF